MPDEMRQHVSVVFTYLLNILLRLEEACKFQSFYVSGILLRSCGLFFSSKRGA